MAAQGGLTVFRRAADTRPSAGVLTAGPCAAACPCQAAPPAPRTAARAGNAGGGGARRVAEAPGMKQAMSLRLDDKAMEVAGMDSQELYHHRNKRLGRSAVTQLLCGIYAMVIVVVGIVFPMSYALTEEKGDMSFHVEIFQLYIYLVSLIFLIYLHAYLLRHREEPGTVHTVEHDQSRNIQLVSNNQLDSPDKTALASAESTRSDIASSNGKENVRSRTPSEVAVDVYHAPAPVTCDSDGVNFYLRLGAIGFGTGSMIHDGFRIAQVFEVDMSLTCYGPLYILVALMHLIFTFFQTFFVFKSHRVVINMHKAFVRFGLMHIVATNICVWLMTTISETAEDFGLRAAGEGANMSEETPKLEPVVVDILDASGIPANASCLRADTLARRAAPYLFPCTIEYSLIAAAIVYKMYTQVGKMGKYVRHTAADHHMSATDCHKANKGLFLGLFVTILTLIAVSCFFVFDERMGHTDTASFIFYCTELTLLFLSCAVVIVGFFRLQALKFTAPDEGRFDGVLLVISLFGLTVFNTFLIVSSVFSIDHWGLMSMLALGTALLAFLQACVQAVFILDGLRRCADTDAHVQKKPGRALVTFLLLCNLSLWVVNTFEVRKAESLPLHTHYYGTLAWGIISHMCVPMIIFFRFHSTVCLSDIWIHAYTIKRKDL